MTAQIEKISLNGVELGYSAHQTTPTKQPLVFLHGYAMRSTAGLYDELLGLLADRYAVYALDLRGHGASAGAVSGWSFEASADDVVAFTRQLALSTPILVGHSFGAVVGLLAEIRHPGAFSALCLLSPGPADPRREPVETLQFLIDNGHNRNKLRESFGQMFVRPSAEVLERTVDAVTLVDTRVHEAQQEQNPRFSIDDRLNEVAPPVLLLRGGSDKVVAPIKQQDMASKLQRCKEVAFSAEGHMLPIEGAAIAAREAHAFLEEDRDSMAKGAAR